MHLQLMKGCNNDDNWIYDKTTRIELVHISHFTCNASRNAMSWEDFTTVTPDDEY